MKKFLSVILVLILVLSIGASFVMAEPAEGTAEEPAQQENEVAVPETPAGYDESSVITYYIYDLADADNLKFKQAITANDVTLDFLKNQQQLEEFKNGEKRFLLQGEVQLTEGKVPDTGMAYVIDKGFLADKCYVALPIGDLSDYTSVYPDGKVAMGFIVDFGKSPVKVVGADKEDGVIIKEVLAGQQNGFVATAYRLHWINILIVAMCLVVLILILLVVILSLRKKKAIKLAEENSEFVDEETLFDVLANEAKEAVTEETSETIEEVTEETEEN